MWIVVIAYDEILMRSFASVFKAPEGQDIEYSYGRMKHVEHVYPYATKKKAEQVARAYNK